MRIFVAVLSIAVLTALPDASAQTDSTPAKPKIGIMKFEVDADLKPSLGKFLYTDLTGKMVESGKFTVVDWEEIDRVLNYVAKSQPNLSPEDAKKQAINQLGLEKMYVGSLAKIGSKFIVSVKLLRLDLTVERVEKGTAESEDDLESVINCIALAFAANPEEVAKAKEIEEAWKAANDSKTQDAYRGFLNKYPNSSYAAIAKGRMEKMKKEEEDAAKKEELKKEKDQLLFRVARWLNENAGLGTAQAGEKAAHYLKDSQIDAKAFENFKEVYKWFTDSSKGGWPAVRSYAGALRKAEEYAFDRKVDMAKFGKDFEEVHRWFMPGTEDSRGWAGVDHSFAKALSKAEDYVFDRQVDMEKFRKDFKEVYDWFMPLTEGDGWYAVNKSFAAALGKAEDYVFDKKMTPQQFSQLKAKYREFKDLKLAETSVFGN